MTEKLTALVPTFNEEAVIRDCLESLRWADEVFVVDSFSHDKTVEIAREYGSRVVQHAYVNSAAQKNWAIPQSGHLWVLLVDADERVTPELRDEIREILEQGPCHPGYWIRRANHFLGRRMKHCGWETDKVIRLFRRDMARYEEREVHAEIEFPGPLPVLQYPLLHYSFRSFSQYWRKMQLYSDWGASQLFKEGRRAGWVSIGLRPLQRFLKMYLFRLGFLDGIHGLALSMLGAFAVFLKYAKLWELGLNHGKAPEP
ncbi:MAG: glycosyltransferase family 2 protein [Acidobacteria bacterium]|nr:glycosyltransferase family 2 protein [Acidobacteriota bacterium]